MHFLDLIMKYRDHIFNFYSSSDVLPVILKRSQNVTAKKYWLDLLVPDRFFVLKRGCVVARDQQYHDKWDDGKKEDWGERPPSHLYLVRSSHPLPFLMIF